VIVLLDENFPLGLLRSLEGHGVAAEHIITLGWRGVSDIQIRTRLADPSVLFLTQDTDFLSGPPVQAAIIVSRLRQSRSLAERIDVWNACIREVLEGGRAERLFELMDDGTLVPWQVISVDE
jgi:hypothetical protein